MSHRATVVAGLSLLLATQLACKKSESSSVPAAASASADVSASASTSAPAEPVEPKSAWLDKHGKAKTRFGLFVPGGGKVKTKRGGFKYSTGWEVETIYPTGEQDDLTTGFEILAKQAGAVLIPDENPFGKAWKIIFKEKPYKAFIVKRFDKDECVLTIQTP